MEETYLLHSEDFLHESLIFGQGKQITEFIKINNPVFSNLLVKL